MPEKQKPGKWWEVSVMAQSLAKPNTDLQIGFAAFVGTEGGAIGKVRQWLHEGHDDPWVSVSQRQPHWSTWGIGHITGLQVVPSTPEQAASHDAGAMPSGQELVPITHLRIVSAVVPPNVR